MLQQAPTLIGNEVRARRVFERGDWSLFALLTAINVVVVAWMAVRVLAAVDLASAVVLVPSFVALLGFEARWCSLPLMAVAEPMEAELGRRIGVATTFVPGVEPLDMLRRTVAAIVAMDLDHETWVLDEGDDPDVRRLCDELGAHHFSRRHAPPYQQPDGPFETRTKHGNYNAWLDAVAYDRYDVVVGFDPDHVPHRSYLRRTLGYLRDPRVGYVQAAQAYYNQPASLVARGAAEETYAYYSSVQMAAHALGYPIVTGCHTVHRTDALREVGGYAQHEADDLLITVRYRAAGWRGVYVPEILAAGITPVDWPGYVTQQRRWARSVLDVKLRLFPRLAGRLPLVERVVSAIHGLYYLYALGTASGVALLVASLATGWTPRAVVAGRAIAIAAAVLVACDAVRQRWFLDPRRERGVHVHGAIVKFAKWPFVLLALRDALRAGVRGFETTAKVPRRSRRVLLRSHGPLALAVVAAALTGSATGHPPVGPVAWVAGLYVALSAAVITTERRPPPDPYDDRLAEAVLGQS